VFAELGVELSARSGANVMVGCLASHGRLVRTTQPSCSVDLEQGFRDLQGCGASWNANQAALSICRSKREAVALLERYGLREGGSATIPRQPERRVCEDLAGWPAFEGEAA
jgi:hypothetical protein